MFKDCKELKLNGYSNNGVYFIYLYFLVEMLVRVYCDMMMDGGGWMVGFFLFILYYLLLINIFIWLI